MGVTYSEIKPPYTAHINTAVSCLPLSTQEKEIVIKKNKKRGLRILKIRHVGPSIASKNQIRMDER